jgi:sulfite reductase (ferredoxin)
VYSSAIYEAYRSMVNSAKAILLSENIKTNTQAGIIKQFDELFVETKKVDLGIPFSDVIYQIKVYPPSKDFANNYINVAEQFLKHVKAFRELQVAIKS